MIDLEARRDALAEALVSGEYEQARGVLRRVDGYCCLGVACEVFRQKTGIGEWIEDSAPDVLLFRVGSGILIESRTEMPSAVREFYGFQTPVGGFGGEGYRSGGGLSLADMNDLGIPFEKIAETIRNRPVGMFASNG